MTSARHILSWICLIFFPIYEVGCYSLLYWKRNDLSIRKRNKAAIIFASLAGWMAFFTLVVSIFGGVPCGIVYIASLLVAPISSGPQLVRALALRGTMEYSRLVIEGEMTSREQRKNGSSYNEQGGRLPTITSGGEAVATSTTPSNLFAASEQKVKADLIMGNTRKAVLLTKVAMFLVPTVLIVLAWTLSSSSLDGEDQLMTKDFGQCLPEPIHFQYASPVFSSMGLLLAILGAEFAKNIDDELGLMHEITNGVVLLGLTYLVIMIVRLAGYIGWQPLLQTLQQMALVCSMVLVPCFPETFSRISTWVDLQKKRINPASKSLVPGYARPLPKTKRSTRSSIREVISRSSIAALKTDQRSRETNISWDAGLAILLSSEEGILSFSHHCTREFRSVRCACS
jgi:hypothetical protein